MTSPSAPGRMPALFVGHGSPMNAIEDNVWSRGFRSLGERLPRPSAILAISAHWYVPGTAVTANGEPTTIHDFGGFPQPLYEVQYPAPGDPELAARVARLLGTERASLSLDWGLDHGTWSVLCHVRPEADCPVLQLSIDMRLGAAAHVAIGRALAPLRDEGVLILGSGNVVHNLGDAFRNMRTGATATPAWAADFDAAVARALDARDLKTLGGLMDSPEGRRAHPSPDHFIPLLYVAGAGGDDAIEYPITGFDLGSLSMRSVLYS